MFEYKIVWVRNKYLKFSMLNDFDSVLFRRIYKLSRYKDKNWSSVLVMKSFLCWVNQNTKIDEKFKSHFFHSRVYAVPNYALFFSDEAPHFFLRHRTGTGSGTGTGWKEKTKTFFSVNFFLFRTVVRFLLKCGFILKSVDKVQVKN